MTGRVRNKVIQSRNCSHYSIRQCKRIYYFDILNDIIEYFTLVRFMDNFINVSYAVTISGAYIFDEIFKKYLPLIRLSEKQIVRFFVFTL